MAATEVQNVTLSSEDWELLGELLRREIRNLPVEIHHTDVRAAREALHEYEKRAEALYEKLRPVLGA
jgi:hypothetical protein